MLGLGYFEESFAGLDDEMLLDSIWAWREAENLARDNRQRAEHELQQRLEARGATELPHPTLLCRLESPSPPGLRISKKTP